MTSHRGINRSRKTTIATIQHEKNERKRKEVGQRKKHHQIKIINNKRYIKMKLIYEDVCLIEWYWTR